MRRRDSNARCTVSEADRATRRRHRAGRYGLGKGPRRCRLTMVHGDSKRQRVSQDHEDDKGAVGRCEARAHLREVGSSLVEGRDRADRVQMDERAAARASASAVSAYVSASVNASVSASAASRVAALRLECLEPRALRIDHGLVSTLLHSKGKNRSVRTLSNAQAPLQGPRQKLRVRVGSSASVP